MKSTIYIKCPECNKTALLQEIQGKYICANCSFDFTKLKDDKQRLDELLVNNLKDGPMGQLTALTIHRWITLMPYEESTEYVKNLAGKNGIKLPGDRKGFFSRLFGKK
jgi:DNA-directed RNA polymerase subunit RPC12/RpoP